MKEKNRISMREYAYSLKMFGWQWQISGYQEGTVYSPISYR